jgi:GDPmannose 4,6-dehydratase
LKNLYIDLIYSEEKLETPVMNFLNRKRNKVKLKILIFLLLLNSLSIQAKVALIFGVTGQDGTYLAELLLEKGYEVHGIIRRASVPNTTRLDDYLSRTVQEKRKNLYLHYGDITDGSNVFELIKEINPDEVYNLAAQSHVRISFEVAEYTADTDALGALRILEAIRVTNKKIKYYQASSSEMFGKVKETPQNEKTPFYPRSPYGVAKVFAYWTTVNYREAYGIFACNGILFNHESPLRGELFVTRKITQAVARIVFGLQDVLYLGNLDSKRDWGFARDYVEVMWLMLQQDKPDDYVIATGETHSVREFLELAFKEVNIEIEWQGSGIHEKGINKKTGEIIVAIDPALFRPTEVDLLLGDASYARTKLGWTPKTDFRTLTKIMMESDLNKVRQELK